ncbi:MAG: hypothetical protein U0694_06650 [Anaerolineae bacterium]
MDFVTALAPLLGLAFLIERIVEAGFNAIEEILKWSWVKSLLKILPGGLRLTVSDSVSDNMTSKVAAARVASDAAAAASSVATAAPDDSAKSTAALDAKAAAAEAEKAAAVARAAADAQAATLASWKQVFTLVVSMALGVYFAGQFQIPLLLLSALPGVTVPEALNSPLVVGMIAGAISPFTHQILEGLLNFQKLLEQQKKFIAEGKPGQG